MGFPIYNLTSSYNISLCTYVVYLWVFQDVDIDLRYKSYSTSTRKSLEAWSGSQLDLGLVNHLLYHHPGISLTVQYACLPYRRFFVLIVNYKLFLCSR